MSEYYVGVFAFNDDNAISHARTKGSKNGISTTKGYIPIGQRARGRWDPSLGRYVYSTGVERARSKVNAVSGYAANRAKRAASGAYNNASRAVSGAYGRASSAARTAYGNAARSVKNTYNNAREYLTGTNARRKVESARNVTGRSGAVYNDIVNSRRKEMAANQRMMKYSSNSSDRQRRASENRQIGNEIAYWERGRNQKSSHAALRELQARREYENNTLPGKIEKFGRKASRFASTSYNKVKNWISTAGSKAISSARTTLRKYGSMAVSSIKTAASSTAGKVKNFLSSLFKKKKKSTGTLKVVGTGGRVGTTHGPHKRWD